MRPIEIRVYFFTGDLPKKKIHDYYYQAGVSVVLKWGTLEYIQSTH